MNKQRGSAQVIVTVILVIALLGALGFILWQNVIKQDDTPAKEATTQTKKSGDGEAVRKILTIKELGKTLDYSDSKYDDLSYVMTSVNTDDQKYVAAIYSADLNARLVADAQKASSGIDYGEDYWKYGGNRAVYAYYYDDSSDEPGPDMVDGVARTIIDPAKRTGSSKLYIGFMGPGSPSTQELGDEIQALRDWVTNNLK